MQVSEMFLDREFIAQGKDKPLSRCIHALSADYFDFSTVPRAMRTLRSFWAKKYELFYQFTSPKQVPSPAGRSAPEARTPFSSAGSGPPADQSPSQELLHLRNLRVRHIKILLCVRQIIGLQRGVSLRQVHLHPLDRRRNISAQPVAFGFLLSL
jgi:hypothetical protein